jgi:hypothetical protein
LFILCCRDLEWIDAKGVKLPSIIWVWWSSMFEHLVGSITQFCQLRNIFCGFWGWPIVMLMSWWKEFSLLQTAVSSLGEGGRASSFKSWFSFGSSHYFSSAEEDVRLVASLRKELFLSYFSLW